MRRDFPEAYIGLNRRVVRVGPRDKQHKKRDLRLRYAAPLGQSTRILPHVPLEPPAWEGARGIPELARAQALVPKQYAIWNR